MPVVEPLVIYDAGFQRTALATFGLPLLVPPIQRRLAMPLHRLPGGRIAAELLAVTLAAQIPTLPVLAFTFHQLSLVAPFANLLTVPLLALLLVLDVLLGGAALAGASLGTGVVGVVGVFGALTLVLALVTWPLLWFVDAVIGLCAALAGTAFAVPSVLGVLAWAYFAALAAAIFSLAPAAGPPRTAPRRERSPARAVRLVGSAWPGVLIWRGWRSCCPCHCHRPCSPLTRAAHRRAGRLAAGCLRCCRPRACGSLHSPGLP
jgi:predicted membrane metal-binding protein